MMQFMVTWDDWRFFLAVHREGTLAAAGKKQGIDPTTVGRRIAALEEALGCRLFDRRKRGFRLSEEGLRLLPRAESMEREALALERSALGADDRLSGTVRVTATEMLATRFVMPKLHRFRRDYPEIDLDLVVSSESLDLDRREAEIALRLSRPEGHHLVIRRLAEIELGLYASPRYLEARGPAPREDGRFDGHDALFFTESRAFRRENDWLTETLHGARIALRSSSVSSLYSAAVFSAGIALLPRLVADFEPGLRRLAPELGGPAPRQVWQMVHRDLQHGARIRAVLDFLADAIIPPPHLRIGGGGAP